MLEGLPLSPRWVQDKALVGVKGAKSEEADEFLQFKLGGLVFFF
jgi:hypothetical protein